MFKKILLFSITMLMSVMLMACGGENANVPLTDDEKDVLEQMGDDVNVVTDDNFVEILGELLGHVGQNNGQVYQLEGELAVDGETFYVSRTLVNGDEKTVCSIPLQYFEKDIKDGAWIRVTGIVNSIEANGENVTVLDVVAVEALSEEGEIELQWEGEFIHQH